MSYNFRELFGEADTGKVLILVEQSNWGHKSESTQEVLAVTEQGLYKILWRSNKPKAQQFASKCAEVLYLS